MISLKYCYGRFTVSCLFVLFLVLSATISAPAFAEDDDDVGAAKGVLGGVHTASETTKDMSDTVKNVQDIHDAVTGKSSGGGGSDDSGSADDSDAGGSIADAVSSAMADNSSDASSGSSAGEAGTDSPAMERRGFHPGMDHHHHMDDHHRDHHDYVQGKRVDVKHVAGRKGSGVRGMQARRGQKPGLFGKKPGQRGGMFARAGGKPMMMGKGKPAMMMQKRPMTAR